MRTLCDKHNILLIFDEVITGFGRMGDWTGAAEFGVVPDMMALAKQLTNGIIPMGAAAVHSTIYETVMAAGGPNYMVELPHGYTYSGHPVACAAALATLDLLEAEALPQRVKELAPIFEAALHSLGNRTNLVADIRNYGLAGALQLVPGGKDGSEPALRPYQVAMKCWEKGFYVLYGGDTIQLGLPFISTPQEIDALINALGESLDELDD